MRTRKVSHYIVLPTALADTPVPMKRYKHKIKDDKGIDTGEETTLTPAQLAPDARRSVDGTKMIFGMELSNIFEAIGEFNTKFTKQTQLEILSHSEAVALMQTPEWTAEDVI